MRKSDKPYRFIVRSGRNIDVIFAHLPGKRMSTGTSDMTEAVLFAERFIEKEGQAKDEVPTLAEFAKDFFTRTDKASLQHRHKAFKKQNRPKWYVDNQCNLENYILPRFGDYPVDSITAVAVENWIVDFDGKHVRDLSGGTRIKVLNTFRYVLDDAVRLGYIKSNPAREGLSPSEDGESKRVLTQWEMSQLFPVDKEKRIEVWGGLMWATYFSVLADTGFRPDEAAGLQLGDVYQTANGMAVYTSHTINTEEKRPKERVKTSGKGVEKRVGLLSRTTEALVFDLIAEDKISEPGEYLFLIHRWEKNSWVFSTTSNKHFKARAYKCLGIDPDVEPERALTQYCLRHTFATYHRGSMDEQTLSIIMGHANGVLANYDHRDAKIVISQIDKARSQIFAERKEDEVVSVADIMAKEG